MKADAPRVLKLRIPHWVPKPVARVGRDILSTEPRFLPPGVATPSRRLLEDPRMRNVWGVLSRRRNGTFERPASASIWLASISGANAEERQGEAMAELFHYVVMVSIYPGSITTRSKAEQKRHRFLAKAEELRTDAERWLREVPPTTPFGVFMDLPDAWCYRRLVDASQAYEEIAAKTYAADMWLACDRARADGDVQWVALAVADKFRALFGSPMYGLTATIASVVLGREIDSHTVRHWCAAQPPAPPAVKPQKIAP